MNHLDRILITGLWGNRKAEVHFKGGVNFLIGVNGSGKTTVIKILASVVTGDIETLLKLPFKSIALVMRETVSNRKPKILAIKEENKDGIASIKFQFYKKLTDNNPEIFVFDTTDLYLHRNTYTRLRTALSGRMPHSNNQESFREILNNLIHATWLSVERINLDKEDERPTRKQTPHIDQKLAEIQHRLNRYFYQLDQEISELLLQYQQASFLLPLITKSDRNEILGRTSKKESNRLKEDLREIFKTIKIPQTKYSSRLNAHFDIVKEAQSQTHNLTLEQFAALAVGRQLNTMVQGWRDYLDNKEKIDEPRRNFIKIINKAFQRKTLRLNKENELSFISDTQRIIPSSSLSSGEKQLLVLLSESLLQRRKPTVYLADEPELSLHLEWQENLVGSLRTLNPNSQIIFSTHSPDIVATFTESVTDMEVVIK